MGQEEELLKIAKKLEKMVARKHTEGALDLLKKLNSCQMSIQLLQTTRIGVAVNGVRKHCSDKEVVSLAKVLIKNWKRLLDSPGLPKREKGEEREKAKKNEKGLDCSDWKPETGLSPPRKKQGEEPKDRRDSTDSKSSATSSPKRPSMERSNSNKSKVETPKTPSSPLTPTFAPSMCLLAPCYLTGDSVRDKCVEMLSAALKADDDYKDYGVNCDKMASEIEDHIYQEFKGTDMKYRNRVRSRISNLKDPRNPGLRRNVLSGAISPGLIAKMTAEEMASDELRELRNAMTQEAIREHQMAKTGGTTTDLFQCSKCKKKNCTYNQVQTRSADEPMTTFVLCNECGNRWKGRPPQKDAVSRLDRVNSDGVRTRAWTPVVQESRTLGAAPVGSCSVRSRSSRGASLFDWLIQLPERACLEMEERRRSVGWAESLLTETASS
ncbi:transcription elongation factor A protein 3 [Orycteropus afer afer]|uniref:Transcription elongation factor A protein 3 n=1 Tax=Orycteropus afer afer TaxID=1230840 RepID=A0AC54Z0L6_ORYAF|nr:transcription elongation factor A protein 3 [Orycteropus afer afer]